MSGNTGNIDNNIDNDGNGSNIGNIGNMVKTWGNASNISNMILAQSFPTF